jgi:tetratricopeptide (TPR) repeat protein
VAYDTGDYEKALSFFEDALKQDPQSRRVMFQVKKTKAKLVYATGKAKIEALPDAPAPGPEPEPALEPEPGVEGEPEPAPEPEPEVAEEVTAVEAGDGGEEEEIEVPADPEKLEELGAEAFSRGDMEYALLYFETAIELDPEYERAWNNKGVVMRQMGEVMEAFKCYAKAVEINPEYSDAWYNMGYAFQEQERYVEAIECFQNALEVDPENVEAAELLEQCKAAMG